MPEDRRLIEVAFPLKQASLDSVHEKNVRHGHISTLHIWPARRPLAASRAALIAALLPDPGDHEERRQILERMAGRVVEKIERKKVGGRTVEKVKEETVGGILHWGRENDPDLDWFRQKIRKAYGGRAPKVLDPFAGGGAIPLEAMRLGCEVTAIDINPVAWFILKCTLEYPQKLAGQTRPLPEFVLNDREFMEAFLKAKGFKGAGLRTMLERLGHGDGGEIQLDALPHDDPTLKADLAWHVRAWGRWVLAQARKDLAPYYPTYAEFEPLKPGKDFESRPMQLLDVDENGVPQLDPLNAELGHAYLKDPQNPRWVAEPTVAYLWARTVKCKQCRATVPLLKTRWLCKKDNKRVLLAMEPKADRTGVVFGIQNHVPQSRGNSAQRREADRRLGVSTMTRSGATCPCCSVIMTMQDLRLEGARENLGNELLAVVTRGPSGKHYRIPAAKEIAVTTIDSRILSSSFEQAASAIPAQRVMPASTRSISCHEYGLDTYSKLLTGRQILFVAKLSELLRSKFLSFEKNGKEGVWMEAIGHFLLCVTNKCLDYGNTLASWYTQNEQITHLFNRYALPFKWDYAETAPFGGASGSWLSMLNSVSKSIERTTSGLPKTIPAAEVACKSVLSIKDVEKFDIVITDPPYYQAISYGDLSDFFFVWMRTFLADKCAFFQPELTDKENEIVQHIRADKIRDDEKRKYETMMSDSFNIISRCLKKNGRFIVVFAHKDPGAWETLVAAIIRAGFTVDGSWPIQTEMPNRSRGFGLAALASSVWLVCRKRTSTRPGWDNHVLLDMRTTISKKLRDFWDAGIRGPDFVWAATGPALEAYSKYPVVKKADDPGQVMSVPEFLREVRRIVVDFVVGRVLTLEQGKSDMVAAESLDDVTTYYLLHRHDFGMEGAPIGACILYALSCNLSDSALVSQHDLLVQSGKGSTSEEDEGEERAEDADEDFGGGSGGKVKLKAWNQRRSRNLGLEAPGGRPVPMIDQVHKLLHLWRAGEQVKVDDYLESRGLKRNALFNQLLQALIELSTSGSDERSMLESLSNHVAARERISAPRQRQLV